MNNLTYITCYKKNASDTMGYLFLQSKGRKNRKKKALGIAVKYRLFKDYWNEKDQKFKSGMEQYKILNEKIAKVLANDLKENGEIIEISKSLKQSFIKFWDRQIELITNQGSKGKHVVVKKKLEKYLTSIKKKDIDFAEMTPDFIKDVHYYFKTATDPERLTTNSINNYMKLINNIVRKKIKDDPYTFSVNPFATITYDKKTPAKRTVLNEKEVERLLTTKIEDPELDFVRDMFVFQIFASGMRVSDLCLLRWNTLITDIPNWKQFKDGSFHISYENRPEPILEYVMFKTGADVDTPLTFYVCKALLRATNGMHIFRDCLNPDSLVIRHDGKFKDFKREILPEIEKNTYKAKEPNTIGYKGYIIKRDNNTYIKEIIDNYLQSKLVAITALITKTASNILTHLVKYNCENDFVFPLLNSADFQNINDNDRNFKNIISKSEELKHKLLYGTKIYRRKLDKVGELCKIDDIMPHAARHTFALLMSNAGASTHNIMDELGHTTLTVTDSYMRHKKFKNKNGESFLNKIGNKIEFLDE